MEGKRTLPLSVIPSFRRKDRMTLRRRLRQTAAGSAASSQGGASVADGLSNRSCGGSGHATASASAENERAATASLPAAVEEGPELEPRRLFRGCC